MTRGGEIGVKERPGQREEFQEQLKQAVVEQRDRMKRSIARHAKSVRRGKDVGPDIQQEEQEQRERLRETKRRAKRLREEMAEGELEE